MKLIGRASIALTVLTVLAAIWTPYHWQFAVTAVLTFLVGAAILGTKNPPEEADSTVGKQSVEIKQAHADWRDTISGL